MIRPGRLVVLLAFAFGCASEPGAAVSNATDAGGGTDAPGTDAQGCGKSTCASLGAQCGSAPDGCGGVLQCGACPTGQLCGGGGPNRCGLEPCTAKTCAALLASCGMVTDGCESVLSCGDCTLPDTCGGAGTPNQCGCKPSTCTAQGVACGTAPDGCKSTLQCGACPTGTVCEQGHCIAAGTGGSGGAGGAGGSAGASGSGASGGLGGSGGAGGSAPHAGPSHPAGLFRDGVGGYLGTGEDYCVFSSGAHLEACGFTQADFDAAPQHPLATVVTPLTGACACPAARFYGLFRDAANPIAGMISVKDGYCALSSGAHLVSCGFAQANYDHAPLKAPADLGPLLGVCVCQ